MPQIGFTELRRDLAGHRDRVENDRVELVVTRWDHDDVVIVSRSEWESLRETLHLLGTPANAKAFPDGISELDAGGGTERSLIEP